MIINNKHIQGIFKYSPDLEFERGDFVIYGDALYICTAQGETTPNFTVTGIEPSNDSKNYKIYLGDKTASLSQYNDFLAGKDVEDLYISSQVLSSVMNQYLFGLDERGIITQYVDYNPSNNSTITLNSLYKKLWGDSSTNIFDRILLSEELNFACIKLSPQLPAVVELFGEVSSSDSDFLLLRQYTYVSRNETYRTQEIINPLLGMVLFREGRGEEKSSWKSSYYSKDVKKNLDYIFNYYRELVGEYKNLIGDLKNSFSFADLDINSRTNSLTLQCSDPSKEGYFPLPPGSFTKRATSIVFDPSKGIGNKGIIDITILARLVNSSVYRSDSITIDLRDSLTTTNNISEYTFGSLKVTLTITTDNTNLMMKLAWSDSEISTAVFSNIYYRKYYE